MTHIFEEIRKDHDIQRELLEAVCKTSGESGTRQSLWKRLRKELVIHEKSEERYFYKPLISHDISQVRARHGIAEHHEIDELTEKLDKTDMASPAWLTYARQLQEMVNHHLDEEEHEIFQIAGKALSEEQKRQLANDYREEMENSR